MKQSVQTVCRTVLKAVVAAAAVLAVQGAFAQAWPAKPITLIVPFATGGTTDVLARAVGQELSKSLGQPVIVESKPGAGATLGADFVAKAKPDGYTFLMGAVHHTIATSVYKKLPYDFQKDLAPVSVVALVPNVLVVNPAVPAKNVAELIALAKSQPGNLTYGSNGNGTGQHLIGSQFESVAGVEILHVPYKGSGPLTTDLLGAVWIFLLRREVVHAVQSARKNAGLDVEDRISLTLAGDEDLLAAAREHQDYLAGETLATAVEFDGTDGDERAEIEGRPLLISVRLAPA